MRGVDHFDVSRTTLADRSVRIGLCVVPNIAKMDLIALCIFKRTSWLRKTNVAEPGSDSVTFKAIEMQELDVFLKQIQDFKDKLLERTNTPQRARRQEIPKNGGSV